MTPSLVLTYLLRYTKLLFRFHLYRRSHSGGRYHREPWRGFRADRRG